MHPQFSVVVFISGTGSNLLAILENQKKYNYRVSLVVSDKKHAKGLKHAEKFDVPIYTFAWDKADKQLQHLQQVIKKHKADLIALAGFMKILPADFIAAFQNKIINIHPSLLPKYPGLNTHKKALQNQDEFHGATVHFVNNKLDAGKAIVQCQIKIEPNDTELSLSSRLLTSEHKLFPYCIGLIAQNRVEWRGLELYLDQQPLAEPLTFYE